MMVRRTMMVSRSLIHTKKLNGKNGGYLTGAYESRLQKLEQETNAKIKNKEESTNVVRCTMIIANQAS